MARDERCPPSVLQAIISRDPGLAFMLLSRANYFSLRHEDEGFLGIAASMNRLGVPATAALIDEIEIIPDHLIAPLAGFWASAGAASTFCRLILSRCSGTLFTDSLSREFVTLAGLFYDLGNQLSLRIFGQQYAKAASRLLAGERDFSELLHGPNSAWVRPPSVTATLMWGLPKPICEGIAQQFLDPSEDEPSPMESILGLVRSLSCACGHPPESIISLVKSTTAGYQPWASKRMISVHSSMTFSRRCSTSNFMSWRPRKISSKSLQIALYERQSGT